MNDYKLGYFLEFFRCFLNKCLSFVFIQYCRMGLGIFNLERWGSLFVECEYFKSDQEIVI